MEHFGSYVAKQLSDITDHEIEEISTKDAKAVEEVEAPKVKEYQLEGPDFRKLDVRNEENAAITKYQDTGDKKILEQIYMDRIPSLNYWARKNQHLDNNSFHDIKGELTKIFLKSVKGFKAKKEVTIKKTGEVKVVNQHFNNYLYSAFKHGCANIYNKKKAKKRTILNAENEKLYDMLLSLDYVYGNDDGSSFTLKDVVADPETGPDGGVVSSIAMDEMLETLSDGVPYTKDFLKQLSLGRTVPSLLREYKRKDGRAKVKKELAERIAASKRPCTRMVSDIISDRINERFKLKSYHVKGCFVYYTIELHKTSQTDVIMSKIRKLKKNKEFYLEKIRTEMRAS